MHFQILLWDVTADKHSRSWAAVNSSPPSVNCFDRLHSERSGHQIVCVVTTSAHQQQPLDLSHNKHQTSLWSKKSTR